jgi:hypothetical protein
MAEKTELEEMTWRDDFESDVDRTQKELAKHGAAFVRARATGRLRECHLRVKAVGDSPSVEYMDLPMEDGSGRRVAKRLAGQRLWKIVSDEEMQRALKEEGPVGIWLRHNSYDPRRRTNDRQV